MSGKKKVVVGVTGASGSVYAKVLFDRLIELKDQVAEVGVVFSTNARQVWKLELGNSDFEKLPFTVYTQWISWRHLHLVQPNSRP